MRTKNFPVYLAVPCLAAWQLPATGATAGHCYVAESGTGIIYDYATNGTRSIYATNTGQPFGLAFDKTGNLFVAGNNNGNIYKISPSGSNSVFASPYNGPTGLAVDSSNNLYVGEFGNGYIYEYAPDGTRTIFGQEPCFDAYYDYGRPVGLAFSPSGVLYASDEYYGYLYRGVPNSPFASVPGDPWGVAFDSRSNLYVAASSGGKIYKFVNSGGIPTSSYTTFATNMTGPTGLAFDSNDNLFVADYSAGKIYKFDTNGVQTTFASGLSAPCAVAFLPMSQPANPPPLVVSYSGNSVVVSWQNLGTYTLLQNSSLANTNGWTTNNSTITTTNWTNSITITSPAGNLFFRLAK
jgi:hypothetical protein